MADFSIKAFFGGDTSGLKAATQDASATVSTFADDTNSKVSGVFDGIEHHLIGTRAVATALGTALGLHLQELASDVARFVTGVSKETEDMLKEVADLSQQAADRNIKNGTDQLDAQTKLTLLLQQQAKLEQDKADITATALARAKDLNAQADSETLSLVQASKLREQAKETTAESVALAKDANALSLVGQEIDKLRAAQKKQALADTIAQADLNKQMADADDAANIKAMNLADQKVALTDEVSSLVEKIDLAQDRGVEVSKEDVQTLDQKKAALAAVNVQIEKNAEADSKAANAEMDTLQALISKHQDFVEQQQFKALPVQQQISTLLNQQVAAQEKADDFGNESVEGAKAQAQADEKNVEIKQALSALTGDQLQNERDILQAQIDSFSGDEKTKENLQAILDLVVKILGAKKTIADGPALFQAPGAGGAGDLGLRGLSNISSDVLVAKLDALQAQYAKDAASIHNDPVTGTTAANSDYLLESQIGSVQDELKFRAQFAASYASGGRAGALADYTAQGRDPLQFDTALQNMTSWQQGLDAAQKTQTSILGILQTALT